MRRLACHLLSLLERLYTAHGLMMKEMLLHKIYHPYRWCVKTCRYLVLNLPKHSSTTPRFRLVMSSYQKDASTTFTAVIRASSPRRFLSNLKSSEERQTKENIEAMVSFKVRHGGLPMSMPSKQASHLPTTQRMINASCCVLFRN
jgi:hypothetical protein